MTLICDNETLIAACARLREAEYVTLDTEFLRDKTYWPQLCLIQVAGPDEAHAIDPLAPDLDLSPFFALLADSTVLKVFHAARQDVEIFHRLTGRVPEPLFDTQVAAMVCGFGESVGYEALASRLARARVDKSMRFTDWSQRPLSDRQLDYALADVIPLRTVYEKLRRRLEERNRASWIDEEMQRLTSPDTYDLDPRQAWRRLKVRSSKPRFLAVLQELAAWRELAAQSRDLPRNRVLRDEALLELAAHTPRGVADLARARGVTKGVAEGPMGREILAAIETGRAVPEAEAPVPRERLELPRGAAALVDLLKVLLKACCDQEEVAQKLVASTQDLEALAVDDHAPVPALEGWRWEVFGQQALRLKHGEMALAVRQDRVTLVPVPATPPAANA